jgi:hypothetical protein
MTKNEAEALQYVKKFISDTEAPDLGLKKALEILVGIVDSTHSGYVIFLFSTAYLANNDTAGLTAAPSWLAIKLLAIRTIGSDMKTLHTSGQRCGVAMKRSPRAVYA